MKGFIVGLIIIFALASIGIAQSGRKVTPAPKPTVVENQTADDFSESAPNKPRAIYASPNYPGKESRSKSKSGAKSQPNQTAPVLTAPNQTETADEEVVKVETNLITIPVSVFDRNGLYIPNLRQTDFKVFENGKEQEIAYFGTSDKPFTVILLIDTSPSTAYKVEEIQTAAIAFTNQLKPQDNVMVVEFDANVHVLTEATNDRQKIHKAIRRADFGDGTSLYDAVYFSLTKRLSKIEGRKAIVLFTDGVDTASYKNDYDSTLLEAAESDSLIFPIYYNTFLENRGIGTGGVMSTPDDLLGGIMGSRGLSSSEYALGRKYLEDLAADTGGKVFRPEATPGGLTAAFEGIAEELRRQYNIGYYPNEEGLAGQRKQIKVRVNRPNLVVRSRDSYIAGAGNSKPEPAKTNSK
jgi:VWFA-related protein